jgi:hypothetical protein
MTTGPKQGFWAKSEVTSTLTGVVYRDAGVLTFGGQREKEGAVAAT